MAEGNLRVIYDGAVAQNLLALVDLDCKSRDSCTFFSSRLDNAGENARSSLGPSRSIGAHLNSSQSSSATRTITSPISESELNFTVS